MCLLGLLASDVFCHASDDFCHASDDYCHKLINFVKFVLANVNAPEVATTNSRWLNSALELA